jgi:hypothetical protein
LRDWPEELDGRQKELRRFAEDIAAHLPTGREETAAAGCVLIRAHFGCRDLRIYSREKILQNFRESWLYVILLFLCIHC